MFKLPEEIKKDLENYRESLNDLLKNKMSPARFRGVRVPWGIYSHRGGRVFMSRIRIPAGMAASLQLKALAYAADKYGNGFVHLTTRQDIQIHSVKLEDTIKVMEHLKDYNLSSRGGGGNTIRNIIACPFSGICTKEIFDVRSYAVGLCEYLLRQSTSYSMPRKLKIAFSACAYDCAGVGTNDLGFLAEEREGRRGFRVFAGGGMGASSRVGTLLEDFLPDEDAGYCALAVKNVFYRRGDRKDKHHNRLRFLIYDDLGFDEFKKSYREEFTELKEKEYIVLRNVIFPSYTCQEEAIPNIADKEFQEFIRYNVRPQKQKGFSIVTLRISGGDLTSSALSSLADLEKEFENIQFVTTTNQDLALTWIRNADIYRLFTRLKEIVKDFLYADTLLDVVACKGALTCNLGLCNSPALAQELEKVIKDNFLGKEIFKQLAIKINGCPNACGQHPVGMLAMHGLVRRADSRPVPFYKILLAGRRAVERTKLAEEAGVVPARNVPLFLKDLLKRFESDYKSGEDIYCYLEKKGKEHAKEAIKKYSYLPPYSQDVSFYIDWGRKEEFSLAGLGPGECGAGILDVIEADLAEAKISLEEAVKHNYTGEKIKMALFLSSRALLIVRGFDAHSPKEAFRNFRQQFIEGGIASSDYADIEDAYNSINDDLGLEERKLKFSYAEKFFHHIEGIYKAMDSAFNFPKLGKESVPLSTKETPKSEESKYFIDLKGTPCPLNYVKAKLFLENISSGDILEIILDEGEPRDNVPRSLKNDGHQIISIEKLDKIYKVKVKKG